MSKQTTLSIAIGSLPHLAVEPSYPLTTLSHNRCYFLRARARALGLGYTQAHTNACVRVHIYPCTLLMYTSMHPRLLARIPCIYLSTSTPHLWPFPHDPPPPPPPPPRRPYPPQNHPEQADRARRLSFLGFPGPPWQNAAYPICVCVCMCVYGGGGAGGRARGCIRAYVR